MTKQRKRKKALKATKNNTHSIESNSNISAIKKKKRKILLYDPMRTRKIITKQIYLDMLRVSLVLLVLFSIGVSFICINYINRCNILEASIDTFYEDDRVSDINNLNELESKMELIKNNYELAKSKYCEAIERNNSLESKIRDVVSDILILDYENVKLISVNDKYYNELAFYKSREELYDKYSYAIMHNGERTDITYDQLKTGVDIMEKNGIDPNILFGVIMTESKGKEDAKSSSSTAAGFGQVLTSTGKTVYEEYMQNGSGTFQPVMLLDGDTNIEITANYINQLVENNGTLTEALYKYRGKNDKAWINSVDVYMKDGGTSLDDAEVNYKLQK